MIWQEKRPKKTASINQKVEAVRRFFADSKATNHPIKEHPVSKIEEYVRDLYLDMLCVVAQYESNDTENAFTLIRRIMAACKKPQQLEEYIKRSMEITPERTAEFIKQCKDNGLCEIFMVDSMLLSCSNGVPNGKQVEFLTQFGDMFGLGKDTTAALAGLVYAILGQDFEQLAQAVKKCEVLAFDLQCLSCYITPITDKIIKLKGKNLYYYSLTPVPFVEYDEKGKPRFEQFENMDTVVFRNLIIKCPITFSAIKRVLFIDCQFIDLEQYMLVQCESVENIEVINCKVQTKKCTFLEVFGCKSNITITNSFFYDGWEVLIGDVSSFTLENCVFSNCHPMCGAKALFTLGNSPIIRMSECHFVNCQGDYLFHTDDGKINMKEKNNSFNKCPPIAKSIK